MSWSRATAGADVDVPSRIVIVGAGQAAVQAIATLRARGYQGSIVLVGEENRLPYQRPPLSKQFLLAAMDCRQLQLHPEEFYVARNVEMRLGVRACEIDRSNQRLCLEDGESIAYDSLLLTTGSRPRRLSIPGSELGGVHELRTVDDALRLRAALREAKHVAIVGAGYIGLEVAASCRALGREVTVFEAAGRVMERVTWAPVSAFLQEQHQRNGVRIVCGARVRAFIQDPTARRVCGVVCEELGPSPVDAVVVGVGAVPADDLARTAGLQCAGGIVVDEHCRSSDPRIYAAGDCALFPSRHYGVAVRLECVDNACEQGASAALNMLGYSTLHDRIPSFWSDQYDCNFVAVGWSRLHDELIVRGDPASRSFSVCYLSSGELIAVDTINRPRDQLAARKLIPARARPDRCRLTDPSVPLQACVSPAGLH